MKDTSDKLIVINDLSHYRKITKEKTKIVRETILNGLGYSIIFLGLRVAVSYNFGGAFSVIFENNDFLIKYMMISFILLSFILSFLMKSPSGILIGFISTIISPYFIRNIILPTLSFVYVPVRFISVFIESLLPTVNIVIVWVSLGFLFGIIKNLVKNS